MDKYTKVYTIWLVRVVGSGWASLAMARQLFLWLFFYLGTDVLRHSAGGVGLSVRMR